LDFLGLVFFVLVLVFFVLVLALTFFVLVLVFFVLVFVFLAFLVLEVAVGWVDATDDDDNTVEDFATDDVSVPGGDWTTCSFSPGL